MLFSWYKIAFDQKDIGMKKILEDVQKVSGIVKEFLLKEYVNQCKFKHAIAFIQWRLYFSLNRRDSTSSCQMQLAEIQEIIEDRV
jgi:hypothetical protein